jgi:hypothetical protein
MKGTSVASKTISGEVMDKDVILEANFHRSEGSWN